MQQTWFDNPTASALIEALHDLDAIAARFRDKTFSGGDPYAVIGTFEQVPLEGLVHRRGRTWAAPAGGSATRECMEALKGLRDDWIEVHQTEAFPGDPYDTSEAAEHYERLIGDTPSVDDAIDQWRRVRADERRAA